MDPNSWNRSTGDNPQTDGDSAIGAVPPAAEPVGTVVPIGDTWAEGVRPLTVAARGRRARWAIAVGIVACVALVSTAAAFVISGSAGATQSLTAAHAPKGTIMFMSLRTDLPGDQHQKAADLWSHFPGGSDRAKFDSAIDEMLNKITRSVSPDLSYTSQFKPWMEGEISIAVTDMGGYGSAGASSAAKPTPGPCAMPPAELSSPTADESGSFDPSLLDPYTSCLPMDPSFGAGMGSYAPPQAVVIVALKDRAAAEKWLTAELAKKAVAFTSTDYAGTKLYTIGTGAGEGSYAFTSDALLLGTQGAVKGSLDSQSKGSLAGDANYKAAMKSLSGDSIATFYMDYQAMMSGQYSSMTSGVLNSSALGFLLKSLPAWVAGSVRAESDRVVVTVMTPKTSGAVSLGNKTGVLAGKLPASTIGVMEVHSIGKLVDGTIASLEAPGAPSMYKQAAISVRDTLTQFGGLAWLGDASIVVTKTGSKFDGGIVAQAGDAATAQAKVNVITNLIALAGSSSGLKSRDETYKGVTITVVSSGAMSGGLPLEMAIATKDDLIVAGYSKAFVESVIDTAPGASLADKADYKAVMAATGASNFESGYVDVAAVVDEIGKSFAGSNQARWNLDIKPYLGQLGGAGFSAIDGNPSILRFVITVK